MQRPPQSPQGPRPEAARNPAAGPFRTQPQHSDHARGERDEKCGERAYLKQWNGSSVCLKALGTVRVM
jgi:hypothetical protein